MSAAIILAMLGTTGLVFAVTARGPALKDYVKQMTHRPRARPLDGDFSPAYD